MRLFATAALALFALAPAAQAATYRTNRTPAAGPDQVTCGAAQCSRFYIDSDTVFGESAAIQLQPQGGGAYYEQNCTFQTGSNAQGSYNWVCDVDPANLPAQFDGTTVEYGLFNRNESNSPYGYTGFIATYQSNSSGLPVELVSFAGTASGTAARLTWTTASETNNSGFVVERQIGTAWTDASDLIAGRGTTTERADYAYTVDGLTAGHHTFRLRQIDTDGTVAFSASTTVEIGVDGEARVTLLGQRAVRIETNEAQAVAVRVFDLLGRAVATQDVSVDGTGVVELPGLAAGAYVVRVTGERFVQNRTLVVR